MPTEREIEYANRLQENLASSQTECDEGLVAANEPTLAEEAVKTADEKYANIVATASLHAENKDMQGLLDEASAVHMKVQQEADMTTLNAKFASTWCGHALSTQRPNYRDWYAKYAMEARDEATQHSLRARNALDVLKTSLAQDIQDLILMIELNPDMIMLEAEYEVDKQILTDHLEDVKAAIGELDVEMAALPVDAPETIPLLRQRAPLVEEQKQVEGAISSASAFGLGQSELLRKELLESLTPGCDVDPPLVYTLRSFQGYQASDTNWSPEEETNGSKEEWYRKFGDLIAQRVPERLTYLYNITSGGCIDPGKTYLATIVELRELCSQYEQNQLLDCLENFVE